VPIVLAAILVLSGGYLLRHYFMYAGIYERPYPAVNSTAHHAAVESGIVSEPTKEPHS
jgi:hypothetical protein